MHEVTVKWNPIGAMRFESDGPNGSKTIMDATKDVGGDEQAFSPKNMLLVALGGCTGMDVISILRKMRQDVTAYHLEIKGWQHEEHPKKFDRVLIEHVIEGHNLNPALVDKAIHLSHEKYCGVSASLKDSVEIEVTSRLIEAE